MGTLFKMHWNISRCGQPAIGYNRKTGQTLSKNLRTFGLETPFKWVKRK